MTELQERAYDEIVKRLTSENVVQEAFSSFFARSDTHRARYAVS